MQVILETNQWDPGGIELNAVARLIETPAGNEIIMAKTTTAYDRYSQHLTVDECVVNLNKLFGRVGECLKAELTRSLQFSTIFRQRPSRFAPDQPPGIFIRNVGHGWQ
jgi:hypothetical protein